MDCLQTAPLPAARSDWMGVYCSLGCAIHCAATPVLLSLLPSITAVKWLADPLFHQVVAVACGLIVLRAILPAWRLHRSRSVAALAGVGVGLLFVAAFILPDRCCSDHRKSTFHGPLAATSAVACAEDCQLCRSHTPPAATVSRPLLSPQLIEQTLGPVQAERLMASQPWLSPLGGLLLIAGHLLNIRLRLLTCSCHDPTRLT